MSLTSLYIELILDRRTPIGPDVQQRICDHARRLGVESLLTGLLQRDELAPDVDAQIGRSADLAVLIPWILRPGRDPEQLVARVAREKRVTVLVALAETSGLPWEVYEELAAHPSEKVLKALVHNGTLDERIHRRAIRALVEGAPPQHYSSTIMANIRDLVHASGSPRPLWEEIGERATALPYLLAVTTYSTPTPAHIERWTRDLQAIHDFDSGRWRELTALLVEGIRDHSLTRQQHRHLLETCARILPADDHSRLPRWAIDLDHSLGLLRNYDIETEERIREIAEERDPERAATLLAALLRVCQNQQRRRLVNVAVEHPSLPVETLLRLREEFDVVARRIIVERIDREGRHDLLGGWLDDHYEALSVPMFVGHLTNPQRVLAQYLHSDAMDGRLWPAWALETDVVRRRPEYALERVPWDVLANMASTVPGLTAAVSRDITAALGTDDDRWETFEILGADFQGSLSELLAAVVNLSP